MMRQLAWPAKPAAKPNAGMWPAPSQAPRLAVGLRPGINREMFRLAIAANQAEHMLNWLDVRAGEMIYVDAGTVHAIGPNSIIIETQQNCDITYRLYDYGRPAGTPPGCAAWRQCGTKTHAGRVQPQTVEAASCWLPRPASSWRSTRSKPGDTGRRAGAELGPGAGVPWMAERWWSAPVLSRCL